jgi:hypothetical protein
MFAGLALGIVLIVFAFLVSRILTRIILPEIRDAYGDLPFLPEEMRRNQVLHREQGINR